MRAYSFDSTILAAYRYLGDSTVVEEDRPGPTLTYIQQPGDTLASTDGGDQYTGLDRFGRVIDENWTDPNNPLSPTDRIQYGYDADGNVTYRNDLVNTTYSQVYTYDNLNRLTGYTQGTLNGTRTGITGSPTTNSATYTMDAVGNMTTYGSGSRTVNAQNEIATGTGFTDTYDNNGNMTSGLPVIVIGGTVNGTMTYDAWNDLVGVHYGANTETFWVDANGLRYASFLGATTTITTFSAAGHALEDDTGSSHVTSVWGIGYVNDLVGFDITTGSSLNYLHNYDEHDLVYSVTLTVDHFGSDAGRTSFDPYGNPTTISTGLSQAQFDVLFQGGRYDVHTQTYTFGARNYSAAIGTWMEKEPAGGSYVDGINLYEAFGDAALINVDPSGRTETPVEHDGFPGNYGRWNYDYFMFSSELRKNIPGIRSGVSIELSFTPDGEGKRYWDWIAIVQIVKNVQDGKTVTGMRFSGAAALWTTGTGWRVDGDPQWAHNIRMSQRRAVILILIIGLLLEPVFLYVCISHWRSQAYFQWTVTNYSSIVNDPHWKPDTINPPIEYFEKMASVERVAAIGWSLASALFPISFAFIFSFHLSIYRRKRRASRGLCESCGYDLRASGKCCPECGAACKAANSAGVSPVAGDLTIWPRCYVRRFSHRSAYDGTYTATVGFGGTTIVEEDRPGLSLT